MCPWATLPARCSNRHQSFFWLFPSTWCADVAAPHRKWSGKRRIASDTGAQTSRPLPKVPEQVDAPAESRGGIVPRETREAWLYLLLGRRVRFGTVPVQMKRSSVVVSDTAVKQNSCMSPTQEQGKLISRYFPPWGQV